MNNIGQFCGRSMEVSTGSSIEGNPVSPFLIISKLAECGKTPIHPVETRLARAHVMRWYQINMLFHWFEFFVNFDRIHRFSGQWTLWEYNVLVLKTTQCHRARSNIYLTDAQAIRRNLSTKNIGLSYQASAGGQFRCAISHNKETLPYTAYRPI